jgi:hypothetical protein
MARADLCECFCHLNGTKTLLGVFKRQFGSVSNLSMALGVGRSLLAAGMRGSGRADKFRCCCYI